MGGEIVSWTTDRNWFSVSGSFVGTIGGKIAFTVSFKIGTGRNEDVVYVNIILSPVGSQKFYPGYVGKIKEKIGKYYPYLFVTRKGLLRRKHEEIAISFHVSQIFERSARVFTTLAEILGECGEITDDFSPARKGILARVGIGVHFDG